MNTRNRHVITAAERGHRPRLSEGLKTRGMTICLPEDVHAVLMAHTSAPERRDALVSLADRKYAEFRALRGAA
jgi:hypothetical protein